MKTPIEWIIENIGQYDFNYYKKNRVHMDEAILWMKCYAEYVHRKRSEPREISHIEFQDFIKERL